MNPKRIGNNFEREIAKRLSLWVSENKSDDLFWRDLSSGARATTRKKQNKETINDGDLVAVDLNYKWFTDLFYIDTKSYKECNFNFTNTKNQKSNGILNQWKKVCSDCPDKKIPMMICKIRDRKTPDFIMLPTYFLFEKCTEMNFQLVSFSKKNEYSGLDFSFVDLDNFFETTNANTVYALNFKK